MTILETPNLRLRRISIDDALSLFRTCGDPEVMKYWLKGPDNNIKETEKRIQNIEAHWQTHGFGDWGVVNKKNSQLIGFAGLHYINGIDDVNLGYAFDQQYWRKGFGFETCRAILEFGEKGLKLSHLVAVIWPQNIASIRLAEKCGLRFWKKIVWGGGDRVVYRIDFSDNC